MLQRNFGGHAWKSGILPCLILLVLSMLLPALSSAQDTGYISGTVVDKSGAAISGAEVLLTNAGKTLTRTTATNDTGAYVIPGLPGDTYNITVTAKGFQKFTATKVVLNVAEKARIDVTMNIGSVTEEVVVTGDSVAQVETQSSSLSGTVTGNQITQLQLNGRNFTQLATIVPGVSNQTGQDEGTVGVNGSVAFSFNGGRTEYNNWEIDGGDNMDNGSNSTLNVYPSIDAIAEVKVLTSNYGAQYGRNASGTVEVETKSGTNKFHGSVYYFGRNDAMNARNFFEDKTTPAPKFKKHDFGYTIGGPVFIPHVYNESKEKTFFFWSEEWRKDLVPGTVFHAAVPSLAERGGNFTDVCTFLTPGTTSLAFPTDCPKVADYAHVAIDPNAAPLLAMIPAPTITDPAAALANCGGIACYNSSPSQSTNWREELARVDHNFSQKERLTVRYIHDSWNTVMPTALWMGYSFPTVQTSFVGPGTSFVTRLNSEISPSLLNEFVASYTGDHIFLTNQGTGVVSRSAANLTTTGIFPNFGNKLPDISLGGNQSFGGFAEGQGYMPWNNANPTYTIRDNLTKIFGNHNLQMGVYAAIAQKNEQSSFGTTQGTLTFAASNNVVGTGNAFADLLLGNVASYSQVNSTPKYYFRYQIVEPYFNDDWRITPRLTLNLGLRISLFGSYRDKYNQAYNWEAAKYTTGNALGIGPNGELIDPATLADVTFNDPRVFNGIVQCGGTGQPSGCVNNHLFNPAPRIGFAWDPWGNGKWAVRGGYGIFYDHGNGNEANVESLEATAPLVLNVSQPNIRGYTKIGSASGAIQAFPLGFNAISTQGTWPYVQQWNLNIQHELPQHFVTSIAYVGSKGTHLGQQLAPNQLHTLPLTQNPYAAGQPITPANPPSNPTYQGDCTTMTAGPGGPAITGEAALHLGFACGNNVNPYRPYIGFGGITYLQYQANSNYNSLQVAVTRSIAPLTLSLAYTYSHSIDNSSDRYDASMVDSYNLALARASSNFDHRHMLNVSYVYDLPFFRTATGWTNTFLGGWQWSGIMSIISGSPFNVIDSAYGDNAGIANNVSPGTFVDLVSNPTPGCNVGGTGPQLYNPCAFAAPRGLTFGNAPRNYMRYPRMTNFDMSLLKAFTFKEATKLEFRVETFNAFNHTEWSGVYNDLNAPSFLHPSGTHRARTLQLGLKFLF